MNLSTHPLLEALLPFVVTEKESSSQRCIVNTSHHRSHMNDTSACTISTPLPNRTFEAQKCRNWGISLLICLAFPCLSSMSQAL